MEMPTLPAPLIIYFSATGTTKQAAEKIAHALNGDLLALQPATPYPDNYSELVPVAQKEHDENRAPMLAPLPMNLTSYQTILFGFPIWWGEPPHLIRRFLQENELSGQKLIAFATSGSSTIEEAMPTLADWTKGTQTQLVAGFRANNAAEIRQGLNSLE
ncbi:flavodoxin [Lapidilactobacillus mulanensis]|uniref:Flavodoxin n=1 Tax=Lapidilactobacillus mulanensis TaxID=2485999 RepID=A0ABW4DL70_9LACO|nr:flavodoxin [Lapidilactobacillus mulanensis]